ncbi:MAG: SDR family oxidoreductase [Jatrophihabitans sp.]|nr:MAG: SDR family oxidoreductase [Jatrophihabitans sp.]
MIVDLFQLRGKVALLSGAGRGIGAAAARALAEAGADVTIAARTAEELEKTATAVREGTGRRVLAIPADAYDPAAAHDLVERTVAEYGRLDVLVSVTGGAHPRPFLRTGDDALLDSFRSNVVNGLRLVREAVPHLLGSDAASVVMVSSTIGHVVGRGYVAYGSGKAALDHSVRLLAAELNPRIRVNAVAPGAVLTESLEKVAADPAIKERLERETPLHRLGTVEDVGAAVLYLASPASSYVTGQVLAVDGGLLKSNLDMPFPDL